MLGICLLVLLKLWLRQMYKNHLIDIPNFVYHRQMQNHYLSISLGTLRFLHIEDTILHQSQKLNSTKWYSLSDIFSYIILVSFGFNEIPFIIRPCRDSFPHVSPRVTFPQYYRDSGRSVRSFHPDHEARQQVIPDSSSG